MATLLLPCPFCGAAPTRGSRPSDHTPTGEFHFISCFCGGYSTNAWKGADSEAAVARAWNTRAPAYKNIEGCALNDHRVKDT